MDDAPATEDQEGPRAAPVTGLLTASRYEVLPTTTGTSELEQIPPSTVLTVTCSPRRGIDATIAKAAELRTVGYPVCPHLAARQVRDREHLRDLLRQLGDLGITDVFVPGGDVAAPVGSYDSAAQLLRDMRELDHSLREVGVTAYPEGHPLIDAANLEKALLEKQELATYMVTQLCFSPEAVGSWLRAMRGLGVAMPVWVGIPGSVRFERLLRVALKVGVGDSLSFLRKQRRLVGQLLGVRRYSPSDLAREIAEELAEDRAVVGFHIYTFGQLRDTERWRQELMAAGTDLEEA